MITLIFGSQGSGKTLFLTMQAYSAYLKNRNVYSNYQLNFPFTPLDYNDIMQCNLRNGVVLIDEAHNLLNSRTSMSKININITTAWLTMLRKSSIDCYASSQLPRQLDVRLRENADFVGHCKKMCLFKKGGRWEIADVIQGKDYPKNIPVVIEVEITRLEDEKTSKVRFMANPLFDKFATGQIMKMVTEKDFKGKI